MRAWVRSPLKGILYDVKDSHASLVCQMSDGSELEVELHERRPGQLEVRCATGELVVRPRVGNVVGVECTFKPTAAARRGWELKAKGRKK